MSFFEALWNSRALVTALTGRDLSTRYRGSVLGFVWSFLNPLLQLAIYTLLFGFYMRSDVPNYSLFLFLGLLPWVWFSGAINQGASSIISGGSLITKVRFCPQVFPVVALLSNGVNFLLSLPIAFLAVAWVTGGIPWTVVFLPLVILIQLVFTLPFVLVVSSLSVHFRDIIHLIGNLLMLWFFSTPIVYSPDLVPDVLHFTLILNPAAVLVQAYRDVMLYGQAPAWAPLLGLLLVSIPMVAVSVSMFLRVERRFAEVL